MKEMQSRVPWFSDDFDEEDRPIVLDDDPDLLRFRQSSKQSSPEEQEFLSTFASQVDEALQEVREEHFDAHMKEMKSRAEWPLDDRQSASDAGIKSV